MNTKKKLLNEIEDKANKIRKKKDEVKNKVITVESIVFDFFKDAEDAILIRKVDGTMYGYSFSLLKSAHQKMQELLRLHFDLACKVNIEYTSDDKSQIKGVSISWSPHYTVRHNCSSISYIDITDLIFSN